MYVTPGEAAKFHGVTTETLRKWAKDGKIEYKKTLGGHHRYFIIDYHVKGSSPSGWSRLKQTLLGCVCFSA